jgi:hypothetical protein
MYGADKVWVQLHRDGIGVGRCTVEGLMRQLGLRGAACGKAKIYRSSVAASWRVAGSGRAGDTILPLVTLSCRRGHLMVSPALREGLDWYEPHSAPAPPSTPFNAIARAWPTTSERTSCSRIHAHVKFSVWTCAKCGAGHPLACSARSLRFPPDSTEHSYLVGLAPGCGLRAPSGARHDARLQQF